MSHGDKKVLRGKAEATFSIGRVDWEPGGCQAVCTVFHHLISLVGYQMISCGEFLFYNKQAKHSGAKISSVPDTSAPHIGQHSPN